MASILPVSSEQIFANSARVRYARLLCGLSSLYSFRHASILLRASFRFTNRFGFRHSSRTGLEALHLPVLHRLARLDVNNRDVFVQTSRGFHIAELILFFPVGRAPLEDVRECASRNSILRTRTR